MKHVRLKPLSLRLHPEFNERWLHDVIAEDPSILGLGDVIVKDRERIHVGAGRLDLLLQDADGHSRYEVEIQLGATDESHLIRTIEYWDIERKRYPQYDHTAVIIAEDVTSRFLNVIGLFNGYIPLMALQVTAIETPDGVGLHFTKILDTVRLGIDDVGDIEPVNRKYWEANRGTPETVRMADEIIGIARGFISNLEPSYNKEYIGFWIDGKACNFAICMAQRSALRLNIYLPQAEEIDQQIESSGINFLNYDRQYEAYRLRLQAGDIEKHRELLASLLKLAYKRRM